MLEERNGRYYYYRYQRDGSRVRRYYIASGELAILTARADEAQREQRQAERQRLQTQAHRHEELLAALQPFSQLLDQVVRAALQHVGFHQHARGEWRLRREQRPFAK